MLYINPREKRRLREVEILEFKKMIYGGFKSLMNGGRAFLHDKSGHVF